MLTAGPAAGWEFLNWTGDASDTSEVTQWGAPKLPTGTDGYGVYFEIKLADGQENVFWIKKLNFT